MTSASQNANDSGPVLVSSLIVIVDATWELFKNKVGSLLGISGNEANPWNPQHAFMATAVYMSELGADSTSYTAERNAACKYYSGSGLSFDNPSAAVIM